MAFRGNYPVLQTLHKIATVFLGVVPTIFFCLFSFILFIATAFTIILSLLCGSLEVTSVNSMIETLVFGVVSASLMTGIWLLITRKIFAQYKGSHDLDKESKFASVAVLLMFFGGLGLHRFFVGRIASGVIFLFTFGFLGIGVLVDGVM